MTSLQKKYCGAQDVYFTPGGLDPKTFESEYLDTQTAIAVWKKVNMQDVVLSSVREEYDRLSEKFERDPSEYAEEYVDKKRKWQEEGLWDLLTTTQKPVKDNNQIDIYFLQENKERLGFTGLQFFGDPSAVESITLEIGGQRFDKIYPSITGKFDPIHLFDTVVPNTIFHQIRVRICFHRQESPVQVSYDRVLLKEAVSKYEALYTSTQHYGPQEIKKGSRCLGFFFSHPVERIRIFSKTRLEKVALHLDEHKLHVPAKGLQNCYYLYEIAFNGLINFSRIDKPYFIFETQEDTTLYVFGKTHNVARFMGGMAGIAFSK